MAEPETFKNQDAEFRRWVREHPDGLVVNVPSLMLNRSYCDHIGDLMTKSAKVCAAGPNAAAGLRRWSQQEKNKPLLICESCEA